MSLPSVLLAAGLVVAAAAPAPAVVTLNVGTIHAAALSTARTATDVEDAPFLLASVIGPGPASGTLRLPASAQFKVKLDGAVGAQSLASLSLQPGDSVRLLLSLMEGESAMAADETSAASAASAAMRLPAAERAAALRRAMSPLTSHGANWIGSVSVLLTNEGGTTYWRAFECVATCKVLNAPAAALAPSAPQAGVAEFSGAGSTYHMQLQGVRAP